MAQSAVYKSYAIKLESAIGPQLVAAMGTMLDQNQTFFLNGITVESMYSASNPVLNTHPDFYSITNVTPDPLPTYSGKTIVLNNTNQATSFFTVNAQFLIYVPALVQAASMQSTVNGWASGIASATTWTCAVDRYSYLSPPNLASVPEYKRDMRIDVNFIISNIPATVISGNQILGVNNQFGVANPMV